MAGLPIDAYDIEKAMYPDMRWSREEYFARQFDFDKARMDRLLVFLGEVFDGLLEEGQQ